MSEHHKIVETLAELRKVSAHEGKDRIMVRPSRDWYIYEAANLAADDNNLVLKPNDVLTAQGGRWVRIILDGSDVETSLTGQANKIPIGDGTNKLDASWIPPLPPSALPPSSIFQNRQIVNVPARTTTTSNVFQTKATLATPVLTGTYRIQWNSLIDTPSPTNGEVRLQSTIHGTISTPNQTFRCADSAERRFVGGFIDVVYAAQADSIELQFRDQPPGGDTVGISGVFIEMFRIA
jgi:hypothetical protein